MFYLHLNLRIKKQKVRERERKKRKQPRVKNERNEKTNEFCTKTNHLFNFEKLACSTQKII